MDIIDEIRAGNKEAIKNVYKDNAKDVYNFAKSITGNHETALEATKKTFIKLFTDIQNGETPTNIRLAALKMSYDEACRIAMPSTENIISPYDPIEPKEEETNINPAETAEEAAEPLAESAPEEAPQTEEVSEVSEEPAVADEVPQEQASEEAAVDPVDTPEEMTEVFEEAEAEADVIEEPAEEAPADDFVDASVLDQDEEAPVEEAVVEEAAVEPEVPAEEAAAETETPAEPENEASFGGLTFVSLDPEDLDKPEEVTEEAAEAAAEPAGAAEQSEEALEEAAAEVPAEDFPAEEALDEAAEELPAEDAEETVSKKHRPGYVVCIILCIILILLLIWFLIGLLENLGVIPDTIDLGYTWFNNAIYPLF
ncbi:MAG: hypothetical protein IKR67_08305 [Lachnospiraceae bacterium]|nr:hypothetical protein [Lachnospiraceae bacterium]